MKLKQLNIKNYRGFEEVEIRFPDNNMAVFVGINGAGKTSVLDLLATFLSTFLIKTFKSVSPRILEALEGYSKEDIAVINEFQEQHSIDIQGNPPLSLSDKDVNLNYNGLRAELLLDLDGDCQLWFERSGKIGTANPINVDKKAYFARHLLQNLQASVPIFVYFQAPPYSAKTNKYLNSTLKDMPQLRVYETITTDLNDFETFKNWFRQEEDFENQEKVNLEDLGFRNPKLEIVRKALSMFFKNIESPIFSRIRIHRQGGKSADFNQKFSVGNLLIDKGGQPFEMDRLSSGEKSLMLLVADIARRLSIANPSYAPEEALQKGEGVVLIDEIEQHLHPRWQRLILPALQATFPQVYFAVTTHSPQVVKSVPNSEVCILDNFRVGHFRGEQTEMNHAAILADVFGLEQ